MTLPAFRNEAYADFSAPDQRAAMRLALDSVRARMGRHHELLVGGSRRRTSDSLASLNPSRPSEIAGIHSKGTPDLAREAIQSAHAYFPEWSRRPVLERTELLVKAAALLRQRKFQFNAWLILESGKSWIEAEADTSEAIDFCEYYARQMLRWDNPEPLVQLPGEKDRLRYLGLGAGVIIPPWNFPLAIMCGMAVAALVAGNTVVIKPSSDTPTIAAEFVDLLLEAGFPARAVSLLPGSGAAIGDVLVEHPKTRLVAFTGSRDVGLRINELAARPRPGQIWIKRVIAEMGGKDAIIVDAEADIDAAVQGILASAFGFQGQKCSACSRAVIDAAVYDAVLDKLQAGAARLRVGDAEDPSHQMGPVINERARNTILTYIEQGRREGRLIAGGGPAPGEGYFLQPTIIADVAPSATIFREEIFGPVLAVTKSRDFEHALQLANDSEYGLTGAVYSRNRAKLDAAAERFFVGNLYLNRKCTGAMVGAHPFGGFNMSGTDSKAGGPDYLLQFLQAKSIAENLDAR